MRNAIDKKDGSLNPKLSKVGFESSQPRRPLRLPAALVKEPADKPAAKQALLKAWDEVAQTLVDFNPPLDFANVAIHQVYSGLDKSRLAGFVVTGGGSGGDDGSVAYVRAFNLKGTSVYSNDFSL